MSEIANPGSSRTLAAQQIIIEFIRMGKIAYINPDVTSKEINELYQKLVEGYKQANNS